MDDAPTWASDGSVYTRQSDIMILRAAPDEGIDGWRADVIVRSVVVHSSEHASRDDAMRAADSAGRRAVQLRRFEPNPPTMP